jgi:hypothetical protein
MRSLPSKKAALLALAALGLLMPSCQNGGHFTLFGYTTMPNYRTDVHTVRVKIFTNRTFRKGLEFQLEQALIHEIEAYTPYKVVNGDRPADTEICGTISVFTKGVLSVNNVNEERDVETTLTVDFSWKDLRSGEFLSKPPRRPFEPIIEAPPGAVPPGPQVLEGVPGVPAPTIITPPVLPTVAPGLPGIITVTTTAHYIPELGSSIATSMQDNVNKMAREIRQLMEIPW